MKPILNFFTGIFKFHKLKIFFITFFAFIFFIIFFPYGDLTDLITREVSKATKNNVYLQLDDIGLGFLPTPGIKLNQVEIHEKSTPKITANSLVVSPSILSLLTFKLGGNVYAENIFDGNVKLSLTKSTKKKKDAFSGDFKVTSMDLYKLTSFIKKTSSFSGEIKGKGNISGNYDIQPSFSSPPKALTQLDISNLILDSIKFNTRGGLIELPTLKFKNVKIDANIEDEKIKIKSLSFGGAKDKLSGSANGTLGIKLTKKGSKIIPQVKNYDINLKLNIEENLSKNSLFIPLNIMAGKFSQNTSKGVSYNFRLHAPKDINKPQYLAPSN